MEASMFYTAVGCFRMKRDESGQRYPIILQNRREQHLSIQEMTVWTALCWRILTHDQLQAKYNLLMQGSEAAAGLSFETCVAHMVSRGLIARGTGQTDFEALYELLGRLYVVPLSSNVLLHLAAFLKLTLFRGVPISRARLLFEKDRPDPQEAQVLALAKQTPLSTAELIKCVELGAWDLSSHDKIMNTLYGDSQTTSENIADLMRCAQSRKNVTMAVSNLLCRKQILLDQV